MLNILEGIMGFDADTVGIENQCITRDTGGFLIGFAETAVNADFLATGTNRCIPLGYLYRCVAVNDMRLGDNSSRVLNSYSKRITSLFHELTLLYRKNNKN